MLDYLRVHVKQFGFNEYLEDLLPQWKQLELEASSKNILRARDRSYLVQIFEHSFFIRFMISCYCRPIGMRKR